MCTSSACREAWNSANLSRLTEGVPFVARFQVRMRSAPSFNEGADRILTCFLAIRGTRSMSRERLALFHASRHAERGTVPTSHGSRKAFPLSPGNK